MPLFHNYVHCLSLGLESCSKKSRPSLIHKSKLYCLNSFLFAGIFLLPGQVFGQEEGVLDAPGESASIEEIEEVPELYITPNRYLSRREEIGSSFSVISKEEIDQKQKPTVLEILKTVPGLDVVQNGGPGTTSTIFLRGAESDQTLVLIDGVRVNLNSVGSFDFSKLKAENIERVEIIRGPQSVLYGSEAIGGVINIITAKAGEGPSGAFSAAGGSFGTHEYTAKAGYANESQNVGLFASYFRTDGFSAASEKRGNFENDAHDNFSVSGRAGSEFLKNGQVDLTLRFSKANVELDDFEFGVGPVDDFNFEQKNTFLNSVLTASKPLADWVLAKVSLGVVDDELEGKDPDSEFNNYKIDNLTGNATGTLEFYPSWDGVFLAGYSFEKREAENRGNFNKSREVNSAFVQKELKLKDVFVVTGGVRHDDDSDFGNETTFRTALVYLVPSTSTRFHGSFGTGFKSPSFNELYFPDFGNPDLKAETSWGYDIGIEQVFCDELALFDLTFFQSEIDDLITFDSETFLAANVEEAKIYGIEAQLRLKLSSSVSSNINYTYTDAENETTGLQLARRPKHKGNIGLSLSPVEDLSVNLALLIVNDRIDSDGSKMDNYERVDFSSSYQLTESVKPFFSYRQRL